MEEDTKTENNTENNCIKQQVTQIKYEKTSCYFCNEWLDSQTFKEHIIHCGQVLEKCPNLCSAYITRKKMRSHLRECPKIVVIKRQTSLSEIDSNESIAEYESRLLLLEQDITSLRSVLNEEIKQRLHLITDVGSLRKHNQITDEWTKKVGDILTTLKKCINEESSARNNFVTRCNEDIGKLFYQVQILQDWKLTTNTRLDQIQDKIMKQEGDTIALSSQCKERNSFAEDSVHKLQLEIAGLQQQISKLSFDTTKMCTRVTDEIMKIQKYFDDNERITRLKLSSLETIVKTLNNDMQTKRISDTDLNTKQMTLDYDVKGIKSIVFETEEKCDKLETIVMEIDRALHQTHQNLSDLEMTLYRRKIMQFENTKGHLIWKITDYTNKFNEAKQYDTVIRSPIFTNKQYGYVLRLDVYLNGIGTWKGRNLVACLNCICGEYDSLLQWPCKLNADIILRDQFNQLNNAQDYIRTTIVKRKIDDFNQQQTNNYHQNQMNTNQFIHIPHKIIENHQYIRNDSIFFEVRVHKTRRTS